MTLRNFCWTLNNPTDCDAIPGEECVYTVYGYEYGENKTLHLQGYSELEKKTRFSTVKKRYPRLHIEIRRGTQKQAVDYCMKDGFYLEFGEMRKQGERTDIEPMRREALEEGLRSIVGRASMQQFRMAQFALEYLEEGRDYKPTVVWLWGPTGCGKSKLARSGRWSVEDLFVKNDGSKWWPGYDAHESVIIDDITSEWFEPSCIGRLLALTDRYECMVETKGSTRQFKAKTIIITCKYAPSELFLNNPQLPDLMRRIDELLFVPDVPEVERVILDLSTTLCRPRPDM